MKLLKTACLLALGMAPTAWAEEFKINDRTFQVPDGLVVELVAATPLVDRPIVADFDEKGRLYVADSSGSNEKVTIQVVERPHKIVRLEDTDGDGKYDKRTIFADKMMFPEGAMWLDGSLYVSAPPSIWKLTDTDGDGVADQRVEWFQGKTLTGCANDLHGPYRGPDGWIYWAKGAFAEQTYPRPGKKPFVTKASHLFRARPDGTGVEPVMTGGMDNPVDVVFTPSGERLFTTTFLQHPAGGLRDGIIHAVYGGVYGKIHAVIDGHPRTRPEMMPTLVHLGPAAPCGLHRYESNLLGDSFRDNVFACQFNLRKVSRHILVTDGASYKTLDSDLITSPDQDFHPTDVIEDFDGSVLVVDTGGWYKLCCPTSQLSKPDVLGGIYRIRPKWHAARHDARALFAGLEQADAKTLAARLDDPNPSIRRRAGDLLAKREGAVDALKEVKTPRGRVAAVWLACRIDGEAARAYVRQALKDQNILVQEVACHCVSVRRDGAALATLLELVGTSNPALGRVAAEAIGRIEDKSAVPALLKALASATDRTLEHSLIYALIEIGDAAAIRPGLTADAPITRRGALIALDQLGDASVTPALVGQGLGSPDKATRDAAGWIISRHGDWGNKLAGVMKERLERTPFGGGEGDELASQLAQLAGSPTIQELLAKEVAPRAKAESARPSSRLIALRAMRQAMLKTVPSSWVKSLADLIADRPATEILLESFATARAWPALPAKESDLLAAAILGFHDSLPDAGDAARAELRLQALASVPGGLKSVGEARLKFLQTRLDGELPVAERLLAADTIARAKLTKAELLMLVDSIRSTGPLEVEKLLTAFETSKDEEVGKALVRALAASSAKGSFRVDTLKTRLAKFGPAVLASAQPLLDSLNVDAAKQKARLDAMLSLVKKGDVRRGQLVFNGTKAACRTCHSSGYVGGKVGPDLTRIGSTRDERDLFEAILFPSVSFVRSYEPVVIETKDGKVYSGIIKEDAPAEVVLTLNANDVARVPRANIEGIRPGTTSVMPAGLDQQLTEQELIDLVTFLRASR